MVSGTVTLKPGVVFVGVGRTKTAIRAMPGFSGTSVIQLGDGTLAFDTGLESLNIDANGFANIGVTGLNLQEMCRIDDVLITNWTLGGIDFSNSQNQNYTLSSLEIYGKTSSMQSNSYGILTGTGRARLLKDITVINAGTVNTVAPAGSIGINLQGPAALLEGLHFEGCVTGVNINGATGSMIQGVTGIGGAGIVTTLVNVVNVGQDNITIQGLFPNGSTNALVDNIHSFTYGNYGLAYYAWGAGSPGTESLISTATDLTVKQAGAHAWASGSKIYNGSGAPTIAGTAGDFYLRRDTPSIANQRIYICTITGGAGTATWIGII